MIRAVVVDIEGTTSSIASVKVGLFRYARARLRAYLAAHDGEPEVRGIVADARALEGTPEATRDEVASLLEAWSDADRKAPPLKTLQGLIWEEGFRQGHLQAHVYDDVAPALAEWRAGGRRLAVYSSGSVRAQRVFFAHTAAGDLSPLFEAHYDTAVGAKGEAASYTHIARELGLSADEVLFLSDVGAELDAARAAGLATVGLRREGNTTELGEHAVAPSFDAIDLDTIPPAVRAEGTQGARLARFVRECYGRGLAWATSGNFSVRLAPDRMLITASGRDKGAVTTADLLACDFDLRPVGPALRPSAEAPLHVALYRRDPRIGAVAHTHSVAATVLSRRYAAQGALRLEGYEMAKALAGVSTHTHAVVIPIVANDQDMRRLAAAVEERLAAEPGAPAYLVAGHGLTTWAPDLPTLRRHGEALEFLLACALAER